MLNIVYTSKLFQPLANSFDHRRFKFVGPPILPCPKTTSFPFEALERKPLIYISLGTIFNKREAFYRLCFEAFADKDWQIVMAIGYSVSRESVRTHTSQLHHTQICPTVGDIAANYPVYYTWWDE